MDRVKPSFKEFLPIIREAQKCQLNESDTVVRVRLLLERVLGYDILKEITAEHLISGHYVDLAVKVKDEIRYLIEAKAISVKLRETHACQAINYASQSGIKLVVLTNGVVYRLYNVSLGEGKVSSDLVFEVDCLADPIEKVTDKLWLLSREAVRKGHLDKYVNEVTSLNDRNMLMAMMSDRVINAIRLELKDLTGTKVSDEAIAKNVHKLFSEELYEMVREKFAPKKEKKPVAGVQPTAVSTDASPAIQPMPENL